MGRKETDTITYTDFVKYYHLIPLTSVSNFINNLAKAAQEVSPIILGEPSPLITLISGGISGAVSRTMTAPIDRIKILMQASKEDLQFIKVAKEVYKKGFLAFFKGNGTNVVKIAPETSIKFFVYDYSKSQITHDPLNISIVESLVCGAMAGIAS